MKELLLKSRRPYDEVVGGCVIEYFLDITGRLVRGFSFDPFSVVFSGRR
jgi:hypothetical protein